MEQQQEINVRMLANDLLLECWRSGGLSLRQVSRSTGVSISTLSRLTGYGETSISLDTYTRLCRWMGVPLDAYVKYVDTAPATVSE